MTVFSDPHVFAGNWNHPETVRKLCADGREPLPQRYVQDLNTARLLIFNENLEAFIGPAGNDELQAGANTNNAENTIVHSNVFFGTNQDARIEHTIFLGADPSGTEHVAVQIKDSDRHSAWSVLPEGKFLPLRTAGIRLQSGATTSRDLALAGQARNLLMWHETANFCGKCGGSTTVQQDAWKRSCQRCGLEHFPRTDLVAITTVSSPCGQKLLLGRQKPWPHGLFSCLAGFLEPGESVSEGVARYVLTALVAASTLIEFVKST